MYNHLLHHSNDYKVKPKFYVINFDNPRRSHRCNPIHPDFMSDISDAYESAYTIMLNLNKTWVQKQGDFFVESPIVLFAAIIWYLRIFEDGRYCTFPHAIEFLCRKYEDIFPIISGYTLMAIWSGYLFVEKYIPYKMMAGTNGQWIAYYIFKLLLFVVIGVFTAPFTCLWAVFRVIKAFR